MSDALKRWDVVQTPSDEVIHPNRAAPGDILTTVAISQPMTYPDRDADRAGCIRDKAPAYSQDDGLAVLRRCARCVAR